MDRIKELLKAKKKGVVLPPVEPKKELTLSDRLLADYFLTHLDEKQTEEHLNNGSKEVKKNLIVADLYSEFRKGDIYGHLGVKPVSWAVFVAAGLRSRMGEFIRRVYSSQEPTRNVQDELAMDVVNQYLSSDFSRYSGRIDSRDGNYLVVCDGLFSLAPQTKSVVDLKGALREKYGQLTDILKSYDVDPHRDGLKGLEIIDAIPELR